MTKRMIGSSGIKVAKLALGGNVFGWTADETASFAILDAFVDAGGTMIDTADGYSAWAPGNKGGESETIIGKWLKQPGKRARVVIATKVGFMGGLAPDTIASACNASLARLGIETIDLYYQHKDDETVPLADSLGAIDALVKAGKVRAIGLSNFTAPRIAEALHAAHHAGLTIPSAYQGWYNMLERQKFEGAISAVVLDQGLAMFPFYGLANGFLTGKYRSQDDLGKSVRGLRNVEYFEGKGPTVLAALDEVSRDSGASLAAIALAWTMAQPGITAPIASATSLAQVEEQVAALTLTLTPAQIELLDRASE